MNLSVTRDNMRFFECFSSETRVRMIELLNEQPLNIRELSEALGIKPPIVTRHIQMLEDAGIVASSSIPGKRGMQKVCTLQLEQATLLFRQNKPAEANRTHVNIPIGQYVDFAAKPTCGLVSETGIIGMMDDPRYFADPEHVKARHLWFASGFVEYRIPNFLLRSQTVRSIEISLELCSEAPGYNENWPSDIYFSLNGVALGYWTCPGDFGSNRGAYTPDWWFLSHTQHGLLKTLSVTAEGTYIDGVRLSPVTIRELGLAYGKEITFRLSNPETAVHVGGISLFGKEFGNYNQDIEVRLVYGE